MQQYQVFQLQLNAPNARIIPTTVPINPTNVPIDAQVEITDKFLDNIGNSRAVASSIGFRNGSNFRFFVH